MKTKFLYALFAIALIFTSCDDEEPAGPDGPNASTTNIVVISNMITEATVWDKDSIYHLPNGVKVNAALTIEAGTVIKLGSEQMIEVWDDGLINATGTSEAFIVFTSIKDDEYGGDSNKDLAATSPAKGDWSSIDLGSSNGSKFKYCKILYGGNKNYYGALSLGEKTSTVDNCVFAFNDAYISGSEHYGSLYADEAAATTIITDNTFYSNTVPLSIDSHINIDNSNSFHKDDEPDVVNKYNGIFVHTQDIDGGSVEWEETEVAFVITYNSLELWADKTLTLGDNVVLKFTAGAGLDLQEKSTLANYNGTGVAFTSFKDDTKKGDTNGDGDASSPTDGDWDGIWDNNIQPEGDYQTWSNIYYEETSH